MVPEDLYLMFQAYKERMMMVSLSLFSFGFFNSLFLYAGG